MNMVPKHPFPDYVGFRYMFQPAGQDSRANYWQYESSGNDGSISVVSCNLEQLQEFVQLLNLVRQRNDISVVVGKPAPSVARQSAKQIEKQPAKPPAIAQRVGDPEKTVTVNVLNEAFTNGYLTQAEFDARMDVALAATSQAQLDALTADLVIIQPVSRHANCVSHGDFISQRSRIASLQDRLDKAQTGVIILAIFGVLLTILTVCLGVAGH